MMATLVDSIIALGLASGTMSRLRPGMFNTSPPEYDAMTWRRTAVPLTIITAAEALLNRTGVVLRRMRQVGILSWRCVAATAD